MSGMELYPRIGPFDLKTWTNCSMGMMSWAVLPLCFAVKQYETQGFVSNSMLVSVVLQQIYVFKFFLYVVVDVLGGCFVCEGLAGPCLHVGVSKICIYI